MATRFIMRLSATHPLAIPEAGGYHDMSTVTGTGTQKNEALSATVLPDNSRQFTAGIFYSDRLTQAFTLSGAMTVNLYSNQKSITLGPYRFRIAVSKITAGGGNVETPIAKADGTQDIVTSTALPITVTPPTPVDLVPNERLILRVYAFPTDGNWGTGTLSMGFGTGSALFFSYLDITETVTTKPNVIKLFPRRTTTIGIGNFMDLLLAMGSTTATTAVVNTAASGTEIQWTKTAGGLVAEWITNRFKSDWTGGDTTTSFTARITALESNVSANVTFRLRLFRRTPSGTETECARYDHPTEFATSAGLYSATSMTAVTSTIFNEDDRLVCRLYIIPAPTLTMGGGQTATLQYDHNALNVVGETWITVQDAADFKLETDAGRSFVIPTGTPTTGLGNGQ